MLRQTSLRRFRAHKGDDIFYLSRAQRVTLNMIRLTEMSSQVATLRLFPGITGATMRAFFMPPIRGVVLETFGGGNAPQRADIMQALKEACDRGVVVVAITQCAKGSVSDAYETGRTMLQAGVVPGGDMTPEVCCTPSLGLHCSYHTFSQSVPSPNSVIFSRSQNFHLQKFASSLFRPCAENSLVPLDRSQIILTRIMIRSRAF